VIEVSHTQLVCVRARTLGIGLCDGTVPYCHCGVISFELASCILRFFVDVVHIVHSSRVLLCAISIVSSVTVFLCCWLYVDGAMLCCLFVVVFMPVLFYDVLPEVVTYCCCGDGDTLYVMVVVAVRCC